MVVTPRGITLLGIDSVQLPIERRRAIWQQLETDMRPRHLAALTTEIPVTDVQSALDKIREGQITGRTVVSVAGRF